MATMKLVNLSADQAIGTILVHNIVGTDGRKVLPKGRVLTPDDVARLRVLDKASVYVAVLEPGDVREDEAAARLARSVAGDGVALTQPSGGRVNFLATLAGVLRVNRDALRRVNELPGVTLATKPRYSFIEPKKIVATLKTIGLAVPESILRRAEEIGRVFDVVAPQIERVAILLTGSEAGRKRTEETFLPPLRVRIEALGARVIAEAFCDENAEAIQITLVGLLGAGAQLILIAGETSIMDADDTVPRGIKKTGAHIELYGAPVEPGNLLLLAYHDNVPIIGAPGCVKSRETNVVDLILPRLMIGEHVSRADVIEMAEGGLLI
jgi:hypothetical protein